MLRLVLLFIVCLAIVGLIPFVVNVAVGATIAAIGGIRKFRRKAHLMNNL